MKHKIFITILLFAGFINQILIADPLNQLFGATLINKKNESISTKKLEGKIVGIYFSAHWCPPCRNFTPELVDFYNSLKKQNKPFEVVFVSSDKSEEAMFEYMNEMDMPWLALPYGDSHKNSLSSKYNVRGIPKLVILNVDGELITEKGRADVSSGTDVFDKWQVEKEESNNVKTSLRREAYDFGMWQSGKEGSNENSGWKPFQFSIWYKPRWLNAFSSDSQVRGVRFNLPFGSYKENVCGVDLGLVNIAKNLTGVVVGGLGAGGKKVTGVAIGGLAAGGKEVTGIAIAGGTPLGSIIWPLGGPGVFVEKNLTGVAIGSGAAIAGNLKGVAIGSIADGKKATGVAIGGLGARALSNFTGVALGGLFTYSKEVKGVQISGLANIADYLHGVQIGAINRAWHGGQIGLLNYNKSGFFPISPIFNFGLPGTTNLAEKPYATELWRWSPINVGFWSSFSILGGANTQIRGLQLNPLYTYNKELFGAGFGMVSGCERLYGLQCGLISYTDKKAHGLQISGIVNITYKVKGMQIGMFNIAEKVLRGFQLGSVNIAKGGFQLGVYNHNTGKSSLQLGLLNYSEHGFLKIFPLINF